MTYGTKLAWVSILEIDWSLTLVCDILMIWFVMCCSWWQNSSWHADH